MAAKYTHRVVAQVFSEKGHYGPELHFEIPTNLYDFSFHMGKAYETLPETLEGVNRKDWTHTSIEITRIKTDG